MDDIIDENVTFYKYNVSGICGYILCSNDVVCSDETIFYDDGWTAPEVTN